MPSSSLPHWPLLLSGLGVAGSLLAAVVAAFALASAIVAFGVWPADPPSVGLSPLTVDPMQLAQRPGRIDARLVLAGPDPAPAAAGAGVSAAGSGSVTAAQRRRAQQVVRGDSAAYAPGRPRTDDIAASPDDGPPTPVPRGPEGGALERLGGAVDGTTRTLARTLRSATGDLGTGIAPLSPALGATVAKTGEALATTVEGLGAAVAALLGHTPRGRMLPRRIKRPQPTG